ncbi:MAG TPA: LysR family transcriptional regulator [Firmicutes bacterium]|nr:LysR family transcriptional regulator [Bacillota bacterium]
MVQPKCKIWLEADNSVVFGGGWLAIFQAIDECGSINQAAAKLGMSYRAAWGKVTSTEKRLGIKLVNKHAGGARSGSELTPEARKIMNAYLRFKQESIQAVDQLFYKHFHDICKYRQLDR